MFCVSSDQLWFLAAGYGPFVMNTKEETTSVPRLPERDAVHHERKLQESLIRRHEQHAGRGKESGDGLKLAARTACLSHGERNLVLQNTYKLKRCVVWKLTDEALDY